MRNVPPSATSRRQCPTMTARAVVSMKSTRDRSRTTRPLCSAASDRQSSNRCFDTTSSSPWMLTTTASPWDSSDTWSSGTLRSPWVDADRLGYDRLRSPESYSRTPHLAAIGQDETLPGCTVGRYIRDRQPDAGELLTHGR